MRLTSIRRRWRQRPEIFRRRWSVATPVGLHPSYVATDHRRFLTTNPGGTPLIIRGKLFRQPRPALSRRGSGMIKIEFSDEDKAALSYERYNHPHPFVQRKMEALWLKSQGLAHKDIRRLTNVCSTTLTDY